ncbi:hypothetical protein BH20ACI1_BH20ACI1_24930 [soil metagenome]
MARKLQIGDQGDDVRAVQDVLNFHIRRLTPLVVDGRFGPATQARVIEFQKSNGLQTDGVVGNQTNGKLFEVETLAIALGIMPKLQLNQPQFGSGGFPQQPGIRPPSLIPPLVLPTFTPIKLFPSSFTSIPSLNPQGQTLNLTITVPSRNDPQDPAVRSFNQIVQLLETLPPNFPFRTAIIGAVPNPIKKIGDLSLGFDWGISPIFDLKKIAGPTEFSVGANGKASYTLGVINQPGPGGLKLGIFAKGDFKGEIDYTSEKALSRPLLHLEGVIQLGVVGRF